jgi:glycosyltransferase involved in cell wall biosynthesis
MRRTVRALFAMGDLSGGGAELSLLELLSRLDRNVIAPELFLLRRHGVHLDKIPNDLPVTFASESGSSLRTRLPITLMKALRQGAHADVIVGAIENYPTYIAWATAVALRKPLIGWVKTDLDAHLRELPWWHRPLARAAYGRCDAVVVASAGSAASLRLVSAGSARQVQVIFNPVDAEKIRTLALQPLDNGLCRLKQKPYMVAVGRLLNVQKGYDLLVRAHAMVTARGVDHNLIIIGEGPDRAFLEELARSLNVEGSVFMPGFMKNPFPLVRGAAAMVAPSRVEGFGRMLIEAMALDVPVVASKASGPMEVLEDGRYGITVDCEDVAALADSMALLLRDAVVRERYARLSAERSAYFDPSHPTRQWEELLRGVVRRNSRQTDGETAAAL